MKNLVIIPTYNEKENAEAIIRAVTGLEAPMKDGGKARFEVLIIDDGSPDGTADIVKGLMKGELQGRLHLVERQGKLGLGTAYIAGFKWALERATTTSSRWTPTSRTTPPTSRACSPPAPRAARTCPSVRVTVTASTSSTGR